MPIASVILARLGHPQLASSRSENTGQRETIVKKLGQRWTNCEKAGTASYNTDLSSIFSDFLLTTSDRRNRLVIDNNKPRGTHLGYYTYRKIHSI